MKILLALILTIGATLGAVAGAQAQSPEPNLEYSKIASVDGHYVEYTLAVTNNGMASDTGQFVWDTLPEGADWFIIDDSWGGCNLSASALPNRLLLRCGPSAIEARHLNEEGDNFLNGLLYVTVAGYVDECGLLENTAVFQGTITRSSLVNVLCPGTVTPTPIVLTPTPTPVTPTATAPPATSTPTATATSTMFVPLPPNTGNSPPRADDRSWPAMMVLIVGGVSALALISPTIIRRYRHE